MSRCEWELHSRDYSTTALDCMGMGAARGSVADERADEARGDGDNRQGILRGGGVCAVGMLCVVYFEQSWVRELREACMTMTMYIASGSGGFAKGKA